MLFFNRLLDSILVANGTGEVLGRHSKKRPSSPLSLASSRGIVYLKKISGCVKHDRAKEADGTSTLLLVFPLVSYQWEQSYESGVALQ